VPDVASLLAANRGVTQAGHLSGVRPMRWPSSEGMSVSATELSFIDFDGHKLAYRKAGSGPALVVLNGYRRRADMPQLRILRDSWHVFQIDPIGYGYSERIPGYAGEALTEQVLAVLDEHAVERFVIWGYSQRGGMAACVARATSRATAMVSGGIALLRVMTPAEQRRGERALRADHPSRPFWRWFMRFDWAAELAAMQCPKLVYFGAEDFGAQGRRLRHDRAQLEAVGVDVIEFEGLDHALCGDGDTEVIRDQILPTVVDWVHRRVGPSW
jgi:pimeloyl-ACP methyl ester carboxylesterase